MITDKIDRLDTSQHCDRFAAPKWWLVCDDYDGRITRYPHLKKVYNPGEYRYNKCGGSLCVEEGESQ